MNSTNFAVTDQNVKHLQVHIHKAFIFLLGFNIQFVYSDTKSYDSFILTILITEVKIENHDLLYTCRKE